MSSSSSFSVDSSQLSGSVKSEQAGYRSPVTVTCQLQTANRVLEFITLVILSAHCAATLFVSVLFWETTQQNKMTKPNQTKTNLIQPY